MNSSREHAFTAYGKQAIEALTEFINSPSIDNHVNTHALIFIEMNKKNQ